ncbi:MAG: hypothetical protein NPIRA06_01310 [Nitrospirales bacterium]|nr:MAG: hypothetical protein NPIRA06_01310 [Nitrospirales bacterium]
MTYAVPLGVAVCGFWLDSAHGFLSVPFMLKYGLMRSLPTIQLSIGMNGKMKHSDVRKPKIN